MNVSLVAVEVADGGDVDLVGEVEWEAVCYEGDVGFFLKFSSAVSAVISGPLGCAFQAERRRWGGGRVEARKEAPLALPQKGGSRDWTPVLVSLSGAWVTGRASPYYPVGNKVVVVRSTSLTICLGVVRSRERIIFPAGVALHPRSGLCSLRVKGEKESHECGFWLWWEYGFIKRGYRDEGLGFVQKEPLNSYVLVEYIFEKLAGVPIIQQEPFQEVKVSVIPKPTKIPPSTPPAPPLRAIEVPATPAQANQVPKSKALTDVFQRVSDLEKDVKELKQVNHSLAILKTIKSQQFSHKDMSEIVKVKQEHAVKEKMPKHSTSQFDQAADDEYVQKDILFKMIMASKSYEKHSTHKALYDALILSLLVDENDMDRLVVDPLSHKKRRHEYKDQDPLLDQTKGRKREGQEKMLNRQSNPQNPRNLLNVKLHPIPLKLKNLDNMANDVDELQVDDIPKIQKQDWFKQPPRLETPDPD
ncbi:hypothetical protein Tco_0880348 [Tanacetum coccineum]